MMLPPNQGMAVAHVIVGAQDLMRALDGTSGFGAVTADASDEQRGTVRDALTALRDRIDAFLA